jgi:predicted enzyme related to lactoylglutathione lyase
MSVTNILSVSIGVSDQDRALEFFVGVLGMEKRQDQRFGAEMRWLTVAPVGAVTEIVLTQGYAMDNRVGTFSGTVLGTDDIQATFEDWKAKGVQFTQEPKLQPWGIMQAQFVDPDGNSYVLVQS